MVVSRPLSSCPGPVAAAGTTLLLAFAMLLGPAPHARAGAQAARYELIVLAEPRAPEEAPAGGDLTLSYRVLEVFSGDPGSVSIVVTHRALASGEARQLQGGVRVILLADRDEDAPGRWLAPFPVRATPATIDSFRRWSAPPDVRAPRDVDEVVREARQGEDRDRADNAAPDPRPAPGPAVSHEPGSGSAPGPAPLSESVDLGPAVEPAVNASNEDPEAAPEISQEEPPVIVKLPELDSAPPVRVSQASVDSLDELVQAEVEVVEPRAMVAVAEQPPEDAPRMEGTVWDEDDESESAAVNLFAGSAPLLATEEAVSGWQTPDAFPAKSWDDDGTVEPPFMVHRSLLPDPGPGLPPAPTALALGPSLSERTDLRTWHKRVQRAD